MTSQTKPVYSQNVYNEVNEEPGKLNEFFLNCYQKNESVSFFELQQKGEQRVDWQL